jgi:hypothetical protein
MQTKRTLGLADIVWVLCVFLGVCVKWFLGYERRESMSEEWLWKALVGYCSAGDKATVLELYILHLS